MGISLKDFGSFAVGAIEEDKRLTEKKFKNRAEELKANRDFVIAQKQKKYESEIKSFESEQKKYKAIQSANAKYEGQDNVNKADWAKAYLFEYKPEQYNAIVKQADGDIEYMNTLFADQASKNLVNYKTSTTRDAIDDNIRNEVESITADYNNRLENAQGDSFLISKLIGEKNNKIAKVSKEVNEGAKGVEISKSITEETQPVKTSESKMPFTFAEESTVATFKPPKKFRDKIEVVREKVNNAENRETWKKAAYEGVTLYMNENDIAKPKQFVTTDKDGNINGFKGAGQIFNKHISLVYGGANKSFTNEYIYKATNKESSYISDEYNKFTVGNSVNDRLRNYTYIEQPKKAFKDRENIIGIVPFSIVDAGDTIGNLKLESKADKKTIAKLYVDALKEYTKVNNKDSTGKIIQSNGQFMNDLQTELLSLNGKTTKTSQEIQNYILNNITNSKVNNNTPDKPKNIKTLTVINTETNNTDIIIDNEENRNMLKANPKFKIKEDEIKVPTETPIEDIDVLSEGQTFEKTKPVASMDFEERRAYEKEKSDERKRKREERNKSFNEKIRKNNEQVKNNKSLTSVKANIPDVDADV
tara:strand:- start:292 stop:2058 length:1767 start_codon:yes stop_codon:yes gene_type:complete